jgi:hypothetical protein
MKPTQVVGRVLACNVCGAIVDVLEACAGATTDAEHRWIVPAEYVCGACCEAAQVTTQATVPDIASVAA